MEDMGYNRGIVERLIEKNDLTDIGEAIDLISRHKFVPKSSQANLICYICEEDARSHPDYYSTPTN